MSEIYVIMYTGVEYNDETYSIGGEGAGVDGKAYKHINDAQFAARELLKRDLAKYDISDFSDYCYDNASDWVEQRYGDRWHHADWSEYIDWCEENNIDWVKHVPELYVIQPVTI